METREATDERLLVVQFGLSICTGAQHISLAGAEGANDVGIGWLRWRTACTFEVHEFKAMTVSVYHYAWDFLPTFFAEPPSQCTPHGVSQNINNLYPRLVLRNKANVLK